MERCQYACVSSWMEEWSSQAGWGRHFTKHRRSGGGWRGGKKVKSTCNRMLLSIVEPIRILIQNSAIRAGDSAGWTIEPKLQERNCRVAFSTRRSANNIQNYSKIDGFLMWTLSKDIVRNAARACEHRTHHLVSNSTDLKMRMLPVWRRKWDKFDMNFFHGRVEIPDAEKTPLYSHTYIYFKYIYCSRLETFLNKVTSSILFQLFRDICMISFSF